MSESRSDSLERHWKTDRAHHIHGERGCLGVDSLRRAIYPSSFVFRSTLRPVGPDDVGISCRRATLLVKSAVAQAEGSPVRRAAALSNTHHSRAPLPLTSPSHRVVESETRAPTTAYTSGGERSVPTSPSTEHRITGMRLERGMLTHLCDPRTPSRVRAASPNADTPHRWP
ncbi:hypothetical protein L227DRAFT_439537 [Lentinus tigrinus ALCF2SS1-6]|uniref:Uncharacterized protein n=1 Tax=Lentinus tigrinus ALCF2SS1-6 TaxID=1328759 RepID=A0A5C2RQV1_9APHY|nr:hypothetical protein L227DRAFT_439537 [Lentinus tigrinus ALCF2SS1-6]